MPAQWNESHFPSNSGIFAIVPGVIEAFSYFCSQGTRLEGYQNSKMICSAVVCLVKF